MLSRPSYELAASQAHPFDYPLSSRFDENDATMIFDRVFVPWENVFIFRELRPFLDLYYKGAGIDAEQRVKLSKLAWDAIGSEFGGRHELYERNYAGNIESIKVETFFAAQAAGDRAYLERLVQSCLHDYDLAGWTGPTWCGPAD